MQIHYLSKVAIALALTLATGCSPGAKNSELSQDAAAVNPCAGSASVVTDVATEVVSNTTVENDTTGNSAPEAVLTADAQGVRYFVDDSNLAIRGTDPVAYFTQGQPVAGSGEFTYSWNNATWQFASAENRDLFAADPGAYAPQYGGFCAWAVSQGYTAPVDPNAWKIVDGKLYLNYSRGVQRRWERDIPGNISKADGNWPGVLTES